MYNVMWYLLSNISFTKECSTDGYYEEHLMEFQSDVDFTWTRYIKRMTRAIITKLAILGYNFIQT